MKGRCGRRGRLRSRHRPARKQTAKPTGRGQPEATEDDYGRTLAVALVAPNSFELQPRFVHGCPRCSMADILGGPGCVGVQAKPMCRASSDARQCVLEGGQTSG